MKRRLDHRVQDEESPAAPLWWREAVDWLEGKGGMVHPAVTISFSQRPESPREPMVTREISKDTIVLQIPTSAVVSRETVEATVLGRNLACIIRRAASERSLYHAEQDLLVALYLACRKEQADPNDSSFQAYLNTLPSEIKQEYDKLPRRWSDQELDKLLTGSCLLNRVRKCQQGLKDDYQRLSAVDRQNTTDACHHAGEKQNFSFPTLTSFDDMMAAVTSRAFAGVASSNCFERDISMVPILDLCNHHRGRGPVEKNVTYRLVGDTIEVRASKDLHKHDTLRITYGAQGNSQLLFNYGFCIPNNDEPDGSSNDVFEFALRPDLPPVQLRIGPKSYAFGGFLKALELFHEPPDGKRTDVMEGPCGGEADTSEDDMEDFLNECEEDEVDGWDGNDGEDDEDEEDIADEKDAVDSEIKALTRLENALGELLTRYSLPRQKSMGESDIERYAKILIDSECRTIRFFQNATKRILSILQKQDDKTEVAGVGNEKLLGAFVNDLADAFVRIRYSLQAPE